MAPDGDQRQTSPHLIAASEVTSLSPDTERIVIADDNIDMRKYLRRLLEVHWNVATVENGSRALAAAREQPSPDLIITDVMMPGMNGFELLRELRADVRTKTIPVILLSARAGEEAYIDGMNAGADDYIVKTFGARELLARVQSTVGNRAGLPRDGTARNQRPREHHRWISGDRCSVAVDLPELRSQAHPRREWNRSGGGVGKHFWDEVFPEGVETEIATELRRAMTERVPIALEAYYPPWNRWYSNRVYPLPDGGLANYFQDITERKRTQDLLVAQKEAFQAALRGASLNAALNVLVRTPRDN